MNPVYACRVCGRLTAERRCPEHQVRSVPRGRSYDRMRHEIAERDGWTCRICGEPIDRTLRRPNPRALQIDHITPLSVGGSDDPANLRATHAVCNQVKAVNLP